MSDNQSPRPARAPTVDEQYKPTLWDYLKANYKLVIIGLGLLILGAVIGRLFPPFVLDPGFGESSSPAHRLQDFLQSARLSLPFQPRGQAIKPLKNTLKKKNGGTEPSGALDWLCPPKKRRNWLGSKRFPYCSTGRKNGKTH